MLMATQVDAYAEEIAKFSTQSLAKLYMTKAMNTNNWLEINTMYNILN